MDYNYGLVDTLEKGIDAAITKNSKKIVDAINNLAMNTGNKTTREYNELKKKYTELENKYKKSDALLKSIITTYTLVVFNHTYMNGPLNSDKVIEIMDRTYDDIQKNQDNYMCDFLHENMINTANEVYEKLIRR